MAGRQSEDALQDTLLSAWQGLGGFEGRASIRTWLYRIGEVVWLEPFPDALLEDVTGAPPGPEACYEQAESISLAFVTALQALPPRQLAVLILRDVLGFYASEVAVLPRFGLPLSLPGQ